MNREGLMTQAVEWVAYVGAPLYDEDGNVVGRIEEFYVETEDGDGLQVSVSREAIGDAPRAEEGEDLSADEERRMYEHYEQTYPEEESGREAKAAHKTKSGDKPEGEERRPGLLRRLLGRDRR